MKSVIKILKVLTMSILLCIMSGIILLSIILEPTIKIKNWQTLDQNKLISINNTLEIVDKDDNIISGEMYENNRIYAKIDNVNKYTTEAFISIEDKRFYSHGGVDVLRIASAIKNDIKAMSYKEGASTITQQLIKNTHLSNEKKMSRKLQEIRLARELERKLTKEEILEIYLNILYFGNNIYGLGTAAKLMFDKTPENLSLSESALLAAIINNPNKYNPYKNKEASLTRRNIVLKQMLKNNKINQEEFDSAISEPLKVKEIEQNNKQYMNYVISEAAHILHCDEAEVFKHNYVIGTNLDLNLQEKLTGSVNNIVFPIDTQHNAIIIDNKNSEVVSVVSNSNMNLSSLKRQPGSAIKPLLCYAPALEKNIISPITPILDEKISFSDYSPSNYKGTYLGWTSVQNSLINSSNSCAVKLLDMNGIEYSKSFARKAGYTFATNDNSYALALGGMTEGVTLKQIADSYTVFANNGNFTKSAYIRYIKDSTGKYIYRRKPTESRVFSESTAYLTNTMLNECARSGTAKLLKEYASICAKTGTVGDKDGNTDAYCIAYNADFTVAVWVGNKDIKTKSNIIGGGHCAIITKNILRELSHKFISGFKKPDSVVEVDIDLNELNVKHRIVAASEIIPPKERQKAYFSIKNAPKIPKKAEKNYEILYDSLYDRDFYNLEIA